jgi:hypothetical protein
MLKLPLNVTVQILIVALQSPQQATVSFMTGNYGRIPILHKDSTVLGCNTVSQEKFMTLLMMIVPSSSGTGSPRKINV